MKKSLLALAALTAFAGAASAQSSVTLFGVVDLSLGQVDNGQVDKFLMMTDGNASSRLGFRGVEDLGGGLRVEFWIEGALNADDGTASSTALPPGAAATAAANYNRFWNRKTTLGVKGNWGEVRLGRDYTPQFSNWPAFDPFGANGLGNSLNLQQGVANAQTGNLATLVRADNTIAYHLPAFGGLYGTVMYALGEGQLANKMLGGRIGYAAGPFNVAFAYSQTEEIDQVPRDATNWNAGAAWQIGPFRLSGFYSSIESSDNAFEQQNWYVGGAWAIGATTVKATYGSMERDSRAGAACLNGRTSCEATQIAVGATYDLSKRTALYATYSTIDNTDVGLRVFTGTNALPARADNNSGYQFGIRHSF